jgi:hypothetical protein
MNRNKILQAELNYDIKKILQQEGKGGYKIYLCKKKSKK